VSQSGEPDLAVFLAEWLGAWPDTDGLTIVASHQRERPSWDGSVRDVVGVGTAGRAVISVAPALADAVRAQVPDWHAVPSRLPAAVGRPGAHAFFGTFRWTLKPTDLPDAGAWVPVDDPRVPEWLRPFGGNVLIAFADDGSYASGVGIKRHNAAGLELSVGTEERHRGRGLAARLVAQASRWVLSTGAVPIYLHDPANTASDRTALAAGFPDEGWQILGVWGGTPS
jgi:GNAT superfamily N-acetyltransferase